MSTRIDFKAADGKDTSGEIALPAGGGKAGGVVLIQEYWGLNDHIRDLLGRLADAGFVALAPDLYHGVTTKDAAKAGELMQSLDWARALAEIGGAAEALKKHDRGNGKVAVMGFCLGGALTLKASTVVPGLSAAVAFYGIPDVDKTDWANVSAPIQAHFSKRDPWATPESAERVKKKLEGMGKSMELFLYDADHAFMNDTRPEVHSPADAKLAWDRAVELLKMRLA